MSPNENAPDRSGVRRVLVIDDQESIREDFRKILAVSAGHATSDARSAFFGDDEAPSEGLVFEVTTASQSEEGVSHARRARDQGAPFDMAFVDVRMPPGSDGIQTIKELWALDPRLHVVICTAYSDYSFEEILESLGQSDRLLILKKPFDPVEVRQLAGALTEKCLVERHMIAQMEALRLAQERAESANRAKTEFLANMSHEIRTPMNAVLGYVDLLCDPEASIEDRRRHGRTVRKSSEHLLAILNDILDVSRIEASRLVLNTADFSPFDLVHDVASMLESSASEKDLALTLEVPGPVPQVIENDLVRVRQVLLNLLGNAIKFTHEGSVKLVLRLDENEEAEHRYLHFEVTDTGIGIAPERLGKVFEAFRQADGSNTRAYGGAGLGLTISKRLALLMGGDVEVESELGVGTTFRLSLYAGEVRPSMLRQYTPEECRLGEREVPSVVDEEDIAVTGRVLIAEDVKFNQLLIGALMRRSGAAVELAENGREALDLVLAARDRGEPFDLVLMDMQMPVMDGYEATRALRAKGIDAPVIALTARAMSGDRERCLAAGCDEYATKPFDKRGLLTLCARLLAERGTRPALPSDARRASPAD